MFKAHKIALKSSSGVRNNPLMNKYKVVLSQ